MTDAHDRKPLSGFRVLDFTSFLSGPFCTQVLADLGADVVKVEPPCGDSSRHIPPHFVEGDSAYFLANNRQKSSVVLDMKDPDGLKLAERLIAASDVVVENFRPGVMRKLGLDPEDMRSRHPDLIWAAITGFGQDSPWSKRPAYDMIVQALSGVMSLTGEPGRPAARLGIPAGDVVAGLYAVIAIAAVLADRSRGGGGRTIDVAMLDCQLSMLSYQSAYALIGGVTPGPQGARHDSIPTYRSFRCGDGCEIVVTANTEAMWRGLCKALGREDLLADPRFATAIARLDNRAALWAQLEPAFATRSAAEWVALMEAHEVPVAPIKTVPEALQDARDHGREMIQTLQRGDTKIEVVGNPIRFRPSPPPRESTYPPAIGADTASVLQSWLDLTQPELQSLQATGAFGSR